MRRGWLWAAVWLWGDVAMADWAPGRGVAREYARGVAALDVGELDEAEAHFRNVLRDEPACGQARHALGLALLRQNNKPEALGLFEQLALDHAEEVDAWVGLSLAAFAAQDFERATTAGERAVALQPASLEAHVSLQEALLRTGDLPRARAILLQSRDALGGPAVACLEAQVSLEAGEIDAAEARLGLCRKADDALAVAIENQVAAAQGKVAQAGQHAARMGLSATAVVARALDAYQGGQAGEAEGLLDEVLEVEPGRVDARLMRARLRYDRGAHADAVSDLEGALGGSAWVDVAWTGAMSGIVRQSHAEALEARVREGAELLVRILVDGGELTRAEERLTALEAELGDSAELAAARAHLLQAQGAPDAAAATLVRALPSAIPSQTWQDAASRLILAHPVVLHEELAVGIRGASAWSHHYNLALAWRKQGASEAVRQVAHDALRTPGLGLDRAPEGEVLLVSLGHDAAVTLGDLADADIWLNRASDPLGLMPRARLNHATLRLQAGQPAEAMEILDRLDPAETGPGGPELYTALRLRGLAAAEDWKGATALARSPLTSAADRFWLATLLLDAGKLPDGIGLLSAACPELEGEAQARCSSLLAQLSAGD